jgi:uncharacterized BrkB/YihY/UPF0761 family membrane protein
MMQRSSRFTVMILVVCLIASLAALVYPMLVIQPFRAQGARELHAALVVMQIRPWLTVISALGAGIAALMYWRSGPRIWKRLLFAFGAVLTALLAVLARVNIFELMFHPVERPSFAASSATKLDAKEKLIAVRIRGQARAYPVRSISYHHVVNDVVHGAAIVATY